MSKIIIAIHGLGNKPPKDLLAQWWVNSIEEGLAKVNKSFKKIPLEMVYWADILYPEPLDVQLQDTDHPLFLAEPYIASSGKDKPPEKKFVSKILSYFEQQLDRIFLNEDMTLNFEKVTNKIIHNYFKDLETYYMAEPVDAGLEGFPVRKLIRERLLHILKKNRFKDILLISHSMGTIISFDVLSALKDDYQISTFITVGSPLGLPIIVSRIFSEQKQLYKDATHLKTPEVVKNKWFNVSDKEDNVALDHTLNDDFAANTSGVQAQDLFVYNDYEANGQRNAHKIYGYLRTSEMANLIAAFMEAPQENWFARSWRMIRIRSKEFVEKINPFKTRESQS